MRVGGDEMDEAIVQYLKRVYNLMIGERTAEEIKITIGSPIPWRGDEHGVKGRDLVAGLPKTLTITPRIRDLQEPVSAIIEAIRITLNAVRGLSSDLVDRGIVLAGHPQLRGMDNAGGTDRAAGACGRDPLSAVAGARCRAARAEFPAQGVVGLSGASGSSGPFLSLPFCICRVALTGRKE